MEGEELLVEELVQRAISSGMERVARERGSCSGVERVRRSEGSGVKRVGSENPVVWPTSEEFTVEKGQQAIEKTVQGWKLSESWKHCIDYLGTRPGGGEEGVEGRVGGEGALHCYRVQWSEPTRRKPVPMATVSTYFFLQKHRHKGSVQACYVLEGQRLVHRPGSTTFQEVWLRNIIQQKLSILHTNPQWSPIRTS